MQRRVFLIGASAFALPAFGHHGWSRFDQSRPIWLEGRAVQVSWRNPHVEFDLEVAPDAKLPPDLATRSLPDQRASVDGAKLLGAAALPRRKDRVWHIELAPLTRVNAWGVDEIRPGTPVAVLGFTFPEEQGEPVLRAEYLFVGGKAYGMRSAPA